MRQVGSRQQLPTEEAENRRTCGGEERGDGISTETRDRSTQAAVGATRLRSTEGAVVNSLGWSEAEPQVSDKLHIQALHGRHIPEKPFWATNPKARASWGRS